MKIQGTVTHSYQPSVALRRYVQVLLSDGVSGNKSKAEQVSGVAGKLGGISQAQIGRVKKRLKSIDKELGGRGKKTLKKIMKELSR